jgi:Mn2+/Fe2+ NRAMP family transporter
MGVSNLIAYFMIVATAATLHAKGITDIATTSQAAQALEPIAGKFASLLFAAGVMGTGLLALPVLAGAAAYAIAGLLRIRKGLHHPPGKAKAFYAILAGAMAVGLGIGRQASIRSRPSTGRRSSTQSSPFRSWSPSWSPCRGRRRS